MVANVASFDAPAPAPTPWLGKAKGKKVIEPDLNIEPATDLNTEPAADLKVPAKAPGAFELAFVSAMFYKIFRWAQPPKIL